MNLRLASLFLGSALLLCSASSEAKTYLRGDYKPNRYPGCSDNKSHDRVVALNNGKNTTGKNGDAITYRGQLFPPGNSQSIARGTLGSTIDAFVVHGQPWSHLLVLDPKRTSGSGYFDVVACGYMQTAMIGNQQSDFLPTDGTYFTWHHEFGFGVEGAPIIFNGAYNPVVTDPKYLTYWVIYVIPRSRIAGGTYEVTVRGG